MSTAAQSGTTAVPGRYIPVPQWNRFHPWPTTAGIRNLIFFAKEKSFEHVVVRVGRRVLLDEKAFLEWISRQGVGSHVRSRR